MSNNKKVDLRIQRSRAFRQEALADLIDEKPYLESYLVFVTFVNPLGASGSKPLSFVSQ